MQTNVALQLRGSSGISPLSRTSRCHLQRRRPQLPPTDDFKIDPKAVRLSQRSRNAQDGHLAGLLTYASANSSAFPDFQWPCARVLSDYSCGAVADSHRASQHQMERSYKWGEESGQGEEIGSW